MRTTSSHTFVPGRRNGISSFGLIVLTGLLGGFLQTRAATLSVSPTAAPHTYSGMVTLQATGLQGGETVILRRWLDANGNGTWDANDLLTFELRLTDNSVPLLAGVTNWNQPFDQDPAAGQLRVPVNYGQPWLDHTIGTHIWELASPTGRFATVRQTQQFTNAPLGQGVTGVVRAAGTNLPAAVVVAIDLVKDGSFAAATLTDAGGRFQLQLPPGFYVLVPARPGWVTDLESPYMLGLGPGQSVPTELELLSATRQLSGRLVDASNPERALPGVFLQVESDTGLFAPAWTDGNGFFTVAVREGAWTIEPAFEDLHLHAVLFPSSEKERSFLTTTGSVAGVEVHVVPANAAFHGRVLDAAGQPLAGIRLRVSGQTGSDTYDGNDPITDDQGRYTGIVVGGTPSWWMLMVDPILNPRLTNHIASGFRFNQTVLPGQAIAQNIRVVEATNQITGTVRDPRGLSVLGIGVFGWADLGGETFYASGMATDPQGRYRMPVSGGPWQVQLSCDDLQDEGFNCAPASVILPPPGGAVLDFTVFPLPTPGLGSPRKVGPHEFQFEIHGEPFVTYQVQVSSDLRQWQNLIQVTPRMDGPAFVNTTVTDLNAGTSPRFYRLLRR